MRRVLSPHSALRLLPLLLLLACDGSTGPADGVPARLDPVTGGGQRGVVGSVLPEPLVVRVVDRSGAPVPDVPIVFQVLSGGGGVLGDRETGPDGRAQATWTLGPSTDVEHRVEVRILGTTMVQSVVFRATATPAPPVSFQIAGGNGQTRVAGSALRDSLVVLVTDSFGNGVPGLRVDWRVTAGGGRVSPTSSNTGPAGRARTQLTLGLLPAPHRVVATTAGFDSLVFAATAAPAPLLSAVTPDTLVPGQLVTFTGLNFAGLEDTEVRIADVPAFVVAAAPDRVVARVPCIPTAASSAVALTTNGVRLESTRAVSVIPLLRNAVGVATTLTGPLPGCAEIAGPGAYLVIVSRPDASDPADVRMRGRAGIASTADASGGAWPTSMRSSQLVGPPNQGVFAVAAPRAPDPLRGDTVSMRIPDVFRDACVAASQIRARVVARGTRTLVLEDVAAPLAGRADSVLIRLHDELEQVILPLLEQHFGDALTRIGAGGEPRVRVLLSPAVNAVQGVNGFTSIGDLLDRASCAASNEAPVFYGFVPTDSAAGYGNGVALTRLNWYRLVRATVAHEVKHLIAFAARANAGVRTLEARWLEEGAALIAEELYARRVFGYGRADNVNFRTSLFCERRPDSATFPECRDRPLIMLNHFTLLARHLAGIDGRSLFLIGSDNGSVGAAWALLRWILDHHAPDEAAFLRALTADFANLGAANLEARTARPFATLFAEWTTALALDDRTGFAPANARQTFTSWNLRDIYAGLQQELPLLFPRPYPLQPRTTSSGSFDLLVRSVPGGSAVLLEIGALGAARQLLDVGIDAAVTPHVTVVRLN